MSSVAATRLAIDEDTDLSSAPIADEVAAIARKDLARRGAARERRTN